MFNSEGSYFEYLWKEHELTTLNKESLLYVDKHLVHDLSAIAFSNLNRKSIGLRRPKQTIAFADHTIPTDQTFKDPSCYSMKQASKLVTSLKANAYVHGLPYYGPESTGHGIVHVAAPDLGLLKSGESVVCGDSHTCTLGAIGCLAFGVGLSDVEHVLATQGVWVEKPDVLLLKLDGSPDDSVSAKDVALHIVKVLKGSGSGFAIEISGEYIEKCSIEERFTICNMMIETGANYAVIKPDIKTATYLAERGVYIDLKDFDSGNFLAIKNAKVIEIDTSKVECLITWGIRPDQSIPIVDTIPVSDASEDLRSSKSYMGLESDSHLVGKLVDVVFIGSCCNGRLSDLHTVASIVENKKIASNIDRAIISPGSTKVKNDAEKLGLHHIFLASGFEWRNPGCSMCVAINGDKAKPGQRVISTTNRNFVGRQGQGVRTHLASPATAATCAILGKIAHPSALRKIRKV